MSSRADTGVLLRLPAGSRRPDRPLDRLAVLSLAVAVYLLLALTMPGAYVIADDAADALHEARGSSDQLSHPTDHTPEQISKAGGEHHNPHHSSMFKRLRGAVESTGKNSKALAVLASYEITETRNERANAVYELMLVEEMLQQPTLPPQLLQRPPPAK